MLSSDPFEREYQQKVLAHLRKTLLAPKHYSGSVRVEIRFSYRQIATDVRVVISSGNPFFDEWAVKAILVANPFPPVQIGRASCRERVQATVVARSLEKT